jgi:hypothetical protein
MVRTSGKAGGSLLARFGLRLLGRRAATVAESTAGQLVLQARAASGRVVVNLAGTGEVFGAINVNNLTDQALGWSQLHLRLILLPESHRLNAQYVIHHREVNIKRVNDVFQPFRV